MSGIIGIVNSDGEPVDSELLSSLTDTMAHRGPDAQDTWVGNNVGFGHAMLRTTLEAGREVQPCSLDRRVWITADARIDARADLIRALEAKGCERLQNSTDVDLILYAYQIWGIDCIHHLLGDFVFAIWDSRKQSLFCARDHLGIKPFYYAHIRDSFVLSNMLGCIRQHPAVSNKPNDLAIANFMLFRYNPKLDITSFADIQRLPPAHYLIYQNGKLQIKRYWTLPIAENPIRYKNSSDYVEKFREIFDTAVSDRLRGDQIGVYMSGGMDSTSIAATACHLLDNDSNRNAVDAYTVVYDHLIPDQERYWSGLVAQHLKIPIHHVVIDDLEIFEGWDESKSSVPEPGIFSRRAVDDQSFQQMAKDSKRVIFTGHGSDPLFVDSNNFVMSVKYLGLGYLTKYSLESLSCGKMPRYGLRPVLRSCLGKLKAQSVNNSETYHDEEVLARLAPELVNRLKLPMPWRQSDDELGVHPWRPLAYEHITDPYWPNYFECYNDNYNIGPLEFRFPFFDLRVIQYVLTIPPLLSLQSKQILRKSMKGRLPESVLTRSKAPLPGSPNHHVATWISRDRSRAPTLSQYFKNNCILNPSIRRSHDIDVPQERLITLNYWLKHSN